MKARYPSEHEAINAREWPGTRQICARCGDATGRCEEDSIDVPNFGPVCEVCDSELRCTACEGEGAVQVMCDARGRPDYLSGQPSGFYESCQVCDGTGSRTEVA